jgi:hypothetical protein
MDSDYNEYVEIFTPYRGCFSLLLKRLEMIEEP